MIKRLLFSLFLLLPILLSAQNTLRGIVTDNESHAPLFAVSVYIADLKRGALTDTNGAFFFTDLPVGKFIISASVIGYEAKNVTIEISGAATLNIELKSTTLELHEVVVTGVSHATELRKSPVPTVVIGRDFLLQNAGTNVIDAISKVPGISQLSTGAAISKPVIRGLGYTRVLTLYDGIRQEGQQWGDEHGIEADQFSIDRIEILKGPASLMYGSDALGGVINLLGPVPFPEGKTGGDLRTEYQTNNRLYALSASCGGNNKGIHWLGRVTRKQAANYSNRYDGKVPNSGFTENSAGGYIGVNKSWGYSRIAFSVFDQGIGFNDGERDSSGRFLKEVKTNDSTTAMVPVTGEDLNGYIINIPRQHITHYRVYSTNNFIFSKSRMVVNLGFQDNLRREFGDVLQPAQPGLLLDLKTGTYDFKYFMPAYKGWDPAIGVTGMYQDNLNRGSEFIIPNYHLFDGGVFGFMKKSFNKLDISGGLRFDLRRINAESLYLKDDQKITKPDSLSKLKFEAFDRHFHSLSGSIGATYALHENLLVKANIARGFRSPNIAELSANGVHEGTFRYEIGNNALKPETSLQEDLGLSFDSRHISLEVSLFNNDIANYIYLEKLRNSHGGDSIIDPGNPQAPAYRFIQGHASLYGFEVSFDIHPHPWDWLHFQNSFSTVYAINRSSVTEGSKYPPYIPAPHTVSELRATQPATGAKTLLKKSYAKLEIEHVFAQNRIHSEAGTETATPGYTLINAGIGTAITSRKGRTLFEAGISGNNLADVAYQNHLSRLKYAGENPATGRTGIYNMGRSFTVTLSRSF